MESLIISIISLLIALSTFAYNWWNNAPHLKIKLEFPSIQLDEYNRIGATITNKSRQPIKLLSIDWKINKQWFKSEFVPIPTCGDGYTIFGHDVQWDFCSIELPCQFEAYDGLETDIIFWIQQVPNYKGKSKLVFNTTRGKITKKINIT